MAGVAHNRFQGLVAAPFTPFHADGTIHEEAIDRQIERLIAQQLSPTLDPAKR